MKKTLLAIVGVLIAVIVVLGIIAPTEFVIEREVVINKPKDFVFGQLKFVKNHDAWSPWIKKDPNMTREFKGDDGTVGFISSWSGNDEVGVGEQEITNIVEGERIEMALRFTKPMQDESKTFLSTEAVGESQTKVKWNMSGKSPFPISIVCLVMGMQKMVGAQFQEGLDSLKATLEK